MNNGLKFACLSLIHAIILQCRSGSGVCPDTMVAGGSGTNDVSQCDWDSDKWFDLCEVSENAEHWCVCVCVCVFAI